MKIAFWRSVLHVLGLSYFIFQKTSQCACVLCLFVQLQALMCYCPAKHNSVLVYCACCLSICRPWCVTVTLVGVRSTWKVRTISVCKKELGPFPPKKVVLKEYFVVDLITCRDLKTKYWGKCMYRRELEWMLEQGNIKPMFTVREIKWGGEYEYGGRSSRASYCLIVKNILRTVDIGSFLCIWTTRLNNGQK